jgi:hypothetical protein
MKHFMHRLMPLLAAALFLRCGGASAEPAVDAVPPDP